MPSHISNREPKRRIPLELNSSDHLLLLQLKHELENKAGKIIKTNDIIREALRELAKQNGIIAQ